MSLYELLRWFLNGVISKYFYNRRVLNKPYIVGHGVKYVQLANSSVINAAWWISRSSVTLLKGKGDFIIFMLTGRF